MSDSFIYLTGPRDASQRPSIEAFAGVKRRLERQGYSVHSWIGDLIARGIDPNASADIEEFEAHIDRIIDWLCCAAGVVAFPGADDDPAEGAMLDFARSFGLPVTAA
jgi:hypothetical protein